MTTSDTLPGEPDAVIRPTLAVVGRTTFDAEAMRRFVGDRRMAAGVPAAAAGLVEASGRLCYDSWDKGRPHAEYVAHVIKERHWSVLEHVQWTVFARGVSRTLLAELTRHRHASFSVRSQRYVDESDCRFVVPVDDLLLADEYAAWLRAGTGDRYTPGASKFDGWLTACQEARCSYRNKLKQNLACGMTRKDAHGNARSLLPGCTETTLALTGNARTFRELLGKRLGAGAEPEIVRFAESLRLVLTAESPALFADVGGPAGAGQ